MKIDNEQKATVFNLKENEHIKNAMMANISTYEGKDREDHPKYSSWRTNFVGDAFKKSKSLNDKDRIVITNGKVENTYIKEKDKSYINCTIFDFEIAENENE